MAAIWDREPRVVWCYKIKTGFALPEVQRTFPKKYHTLQQSLEMQSERKFSWRETKVPVQDKILSKTPTPFHLFSKHLLRVHILLVCASPPHSHQGKVFKYQNPTRVSKIKCFGGSQKESFWVIFFIYLLWHPGETAMLSLLHSLFLNFVRRAMLHLRLLEAFRNHISKHHTGFPALGSPQHQLLKSGEKEISTIQGHGSEENAKENLEMQSCHYLPFSAYMWDNK